jgi:hypothetical protein
LSRIHCLTTADIIESDQELFIRLGDPPTPVPEPFADLLRRLSAEAVVDVQANERGWLFPGRLADQPITYRTLSHRLRKLGFPLIDARVSALRQLVLQAPAPVMPTRSASTRRAPPARSPTPAPRGAATRPATACPAWKRQPLEGWNDEHGGIS